MSALRKDTGVSAFSHDSEDTVGGFKSMPEIVLSVAGQLPFSRKSSDVTSLTGQEYQEANVGQVKRDIDLPVYVPRSHSPKPSVQVKNEWEGYVVDVGAETFTARLVDKTRCDEHEDEEADFPIADVSDDDKKLLKPGGVFRWIIGYQKLPGGSRRRFSQVVFRQLPQWTEKELVKAEEEAKEISSKIQWL